jgi:ADP-ribose pyrophosphatase
VTKLFEGKLFDVVREDGREIVDHPGSVAIVAIDADERVVLVSQYREPAHKELLELPAGTREPGEEPLATAKRELEEECALVGGRWRELAAFWTTPGFVREHMHLYLATGVEEGGTQDLDEGEDVRVVRWRVAEIAERLGEIEDAKTLAGLLLLLRDYQPRQD